MKRLLDSSKHEISRVPGTAWFEYGSLKTEEKPGTNGEETKNQALDYSRQGFQSLLFQR